MTDPAARAHLVLDENDRPHAAPPAGETPDAATPASETPAPTTEQPPVVVESDPPAPTMIERLARVPEAARTERLAAACAEVDRRAALRQRLDDEQKATEHALAAAVVAEDLDAALSASTRLAAFPVVSARLPLPALEDVDPGAVGAAIDVALAGLGGGASSIQAQLPTLSYRSVLGGFRRLQREHKAVSHVLVPPPSSAIEIRVNAEIDDLQARCATWDSDFGVIADARSRPGADGLGLLATISSVREQLDELRDLATVIAEHIDEANAHRAAEAIEWSPIPGATGRTA
jgi:hypothetical protein